MRVRKCSGKFPYSVPLDRAEPHCRNVFPLPRGESRRLRFQTNSFPQVISPYLAVGTREKSIGTTSFSISVHLCTYNYLATRGCIGVIGVMRGYQCYLKRYSEPDNKVALHCTDTHAWYPVVSNGLDDPSTRHSDLTRDYLMYSDTGPRSEITDRFIVTTSRKIFC